MDAGERRRLVYTNLLNFLPVERVMVAFEMSEKEVMDDFRFVALKIRSYKFERQMPPVAGETIELARANRVDLLITLGKLNLNRDPTYSRIEMLPFEGTGEGGMSLAEQAMREHRMRGGIR